MAWWDWLCYWAECVMVEQYYNLQGVNSYLNVIMTLAVLGLVLPVFTLSTKEPTFSTEQAIFLVVTSLLLYGIFLLIQTVRHRYLFHRIYGHGSGGGIRSSFAQGALDNLSCNDAAPLSVGCNLLAENSPFRWDNSIEQFHMPQAFWRRDYRSVGVVSRRAGLPSARACTIICSAQ